MERVMRRGREFYAQHFDKVMELYNNGLGIGEIAQRLGISYSCVYHWVKGLRKPEAGNIIEFRNYLEKNGPTPVAHIKAQFPKHNEIFLTANNRKIEVKRVILKRKFGDYKIWYFLSGQEEELKKRVQELYDKYKIARQKVAETIDFTQL